MNLEEAKDWLRERVYEGARCPCCNQFAKVYKRRIYSSMALSLIKLYRYQDDDFKHIKEIEQRGDFTKLVHWGLVHEKTKEINDDDKKTSGYWRITEFGKQFVEKKVSVRTYIKLYDSLFLGFEGDEVYINDCLGKKFSYEELMNDR